MIPVSDLILKLRLPLILVFNASLSICALLLALCLRFDFNWEELLPSYFQLPLILLLLSRHASYTFFSLNEGYWRYTSTKDLMSIIKAHLASSVFFAASIWALQLSFPRSVIIGEFILSIFFSGGSRFLVRSASEYFIGRARMREERSTKQTIILGAGDSGHLLVKLLLNSLHIPYLPVMILDDSDRFLGSSVQGVKVKGTISQLEEFLATNPNVGAVISAIPSLSPVKIEEIKAICNNNSVMFKKLQSFEDIACLDAGEPLIELSIESVLDKETVIEHEVEICKALEGKRVLITGAGGSIGSEIVRQIVQFSPQKVLLLDNSEYHLFRLLNELNPPDANKNGSSVQNNDTDVKYVVGDIRDKKRLAQLFRSFQPEYVFHSAAYKHVPLMEENCYAAFTNNVLGTKILIELCVDHRVNRFIFISSDKAVDPSSIMGCTKKLGEMLLLYYAKNNRHQINMAAVRFGNVINSTGSVIPIFKDQIAKGGPITVTHPDMERFFMSIKEAVRLVLTAGILGEGGEIYVLDMGRKLKVVDLAKKMRLLYGRRDIEIVFTGLRPGEKLTENLLTSYESSFNTRFRKVSRLLNRTTPDPSLISWINQVEEILHLISDDEIGTRIRAYINEVENKVLASERNYIEQDTEPAISAVVNS